jgi:hypothetical protein
MRDTWQGQALPLAGAMLDGTLFCMRQQSLVMEDFSNLPERLIIPSNHAIITYAH